MEDSHRPGLAAFVLHVLVKKGLTAETVRHRFSVMETPQVRRPKFGLLLLVALSLALGACGARAVRAPVWAGLTSEQIARGVYEKLTAFLKQAQANHPECSADQPAAGQGICPAIHDAIRAQNALGQAINVYCAGAPVGTDAHYNQGGPCSPVLGAESALEAAMAIAVNVLPNLRGIIGGGP